jgi:hypothetical protein
MIIIPGSLHCLLAPGKFWSSYFDPISRTYAWNCRHFIVLLEDLLALHYWHSLASTVGISITGYALISVADMLDGLFGTIFEASRRVYTTQQFMRALFRNAFFHIVSFSTLKAITRAKFRLSKRWIPTVHFSPASHAERTSQRLDSRTSWKFKFPASLFR